LKCNGAFPGRYDDLLFQDYVNRGTVTATEYRQRISSNQVFSFGLTAETDGPFRKVGLRLGSGEVVSAAAFAWRQPFLGNTTEATTPAGNFTSSWDLALREWETGPMFTRRNRQNNSAVWFTTCP